MKLNSIKSSNFVYEWIWLSSCNKYSLLVVEFLDEHENLAVEINIACIWRLRKFVFNLKLFNIDWLIQQNRFDAIEIKFYFDFLFQIIAISIFFGDKILITNFETNDDPDLLNRHSSANSI